jgi:hypothetical protein
MAFRVTNSLVEPYQYISRHDEAVAKDDDDFEHKWELYLDGKAPPPIRAGGKPTIWHFRPLSPRQRMRVIDRGGIEGAALSLSLSLIRVENLEDDKGRAIKLEYTHEDGMRVVSEESMAVIHRAGGDELLLDLVQRVQRSLDIGPK